MEKTVIIEVGGDHGDGNVEVVQKPAGIKVIIRDYDSAFLDGNADEQEAVIPEERIYETNDTYGDEI